MIWETPDLFGLFGKLLAFSLELPQKSNPPVLIRACGLIEAAGIAEHDRFRWHGPSLRSLEIYSNFLTMFFQNAPL